MLHGTYRVEYLKRQKTFQALLAKQEHQHCASKLRAKLAQPQQL